MSRSRRTTIEGARRKKKVRHDGAGYSRGSAAFPQHSILTDLLLGVPCLDRNASHQVDWGDFYVIAKNVRLLYGAESAQHDYAKKTLHSLFDGLCREADADNDKLVSLEEWIRLLEKTSKDSSSGWFREYQHFMFKLFDVSADGVLDLFEYKDGMSCYGFTEKQAHEAWKRWAVLKNGKPLDKVSTEMWEMRFNELFFSKDKNATGNNIFPLKL